MIFIWGSAYREQFIKEVNAHCPHCDKYDAHIVSFQRWFDIYFISLIPTSRKNYFLKCLSCNKYTQIKENSDLEKLIQKTFSDNE